MPDFVDNDATQNDGDVEVGAVTFGVTHRFVVHSGKNRDDGKSEYGILEHILGRLRKYPQPDVARFEFLAGILPDNGMLP